MCVQNYAAESASLTGTRSICIICAAVDNISTDTERHAGLSAITEPLVYFIVMHSRSDFDLYD